MKYELVEILDDVENYTKIVEDTLLVRYSQSKVAGSDNVKNGYKYKYALRKKFYDAQENLYSTSLSSSPVIGWAKMAKPSIKLTVLNGQDYQIEPYNNNDKFIVHRAPLYVINGVEYEDIEVEKGFDYIDSLKNDKAGKSIVYTIRTVSPIGLKSDWSEPVDTFYKLFSPGFASASQSDFDNKVELKWHWGEKREAVVDSFVINRYSEDGFKRYAFKGSNENKLEYLFGDKDTCLFIDEQIKQGVEYTYSIKSKRVNPSGARLSSDSVVAVGYAKFSAPVNVSATDTLRDVLVTWDSIKDQGEVKEYYILYSDSLNGQGSYDYMMFVGGPVKQVEASFTDASIEQGHIRWYKVAAFNALSQEGVRSKAVRGYALMEPIEGVVCSKGASTDYVRVTWDTLDVYQSYYIEWSLNNQSDADGRFKELYHSVGNFENGTYLQDSILIPTEIDSLRGRQIYVHIWAYNEYGGSERQADSGYAKLMPPEDFTMSKGEYLDSIRYQFTQAENNNVKSYKILADTEKARSQTGNAAIQISDYLGSDTLRAVEQNEEGYYYYGGVQAVSELLNASSDFAVDSGYSRIPAVTSFSGEALYSGEISLSWMPVDIGGDSVKYNIYRIEADDTYPTPLESEYYFKDGSGQMKFVDENCLPGEKYSYFWKSKAVQRPTDEGQEVVSDTSTHINLLAEIGLVKNFVQDTTAFSSQSVSLSWKQRGSIDTYYIYRSKFSDTAKTVDTIITVENNYCYYTDDEDTMDIESGMLWHYWIRARKNGKLGAWTPDNDEGLLAYSQPDMPVIDTVSQGISADTIRVQWSKIKYAKKYLVQYKDQEKQEWIELGTNVIDTFYTFERETEGLKDGIRYEFRVTAVISVSTESPVGLEYGGSYGRTMHSDTSQSKTGYLRFEKIKNFYFQSAFDSIKSDTIRLYWDQLDVNDVTYTIYRDTQDTPATAPQLQNMDDKGEYLDIKRSNEQHPEGGRQYYYWITSEKATFAGNTQSEKQAVTVINESNSGTDHYGWALLDQPENIWASGKMQAAGGDNNQELTYTDSIVIKWDKVINAKNYQIQQRRKDIETTWQDLETEELDTQYVWSMSSDSLKGRVYEFQVTAKNELSGDKNPVTPI